MIILHYRHIGLWRGEKIMTKIERVLSFSILLLLTQCLLISSISQGIIKIDNQDNSLVNIENKENVPLVEKYNELNLEKNKAFIDTCTYDNLGKEKKESITNNQFSSLIDSDLITTNDELKNYEMDDSHPYSWFDATGGILLPLTDNSAFELPLPFSFPFYNGFFSTMYVSSNGWLSFVNSDPFSWYPDYYPDSNPEYQYSIAPFAADLYPFDNVFVSIEPDMVVIEYYNIEYFPVPIVGTFEVILFDTGEIVFQYEYLDIVDYYTCGLNYGPDTNYYNLYTDLYGGVSELAISFNIIIPEHDLEASLEAPYSLDPSENTIINATVTNNGLNDETSVELAITIDGFEVASQVFADLLVDETALVQYSWTPTIEDTYLIEAYATPVSGEIDIENNNDSHNCTVCIKTWTVMYYLDGDVNLEFLAIEDFNELERGLAAAPMVNVIVLFDRHPGYDTSNGDWSSTRLYEVVPDFSSTIQSLMLYDLEELNMGDPTTLSDFISFCFQYYPAENYMLNLWDHGGGIDGICWDETDGYDYLTIDELQSAIALSEGLYFEKIDIISCVACLMNMMEVSYELRDLTDYFIASEEVMYDQVVNWEDVLNRFGADPLMTPDQFAYEIVDSYRADWEFHYIPTHFSAIDITVIYSIDVIINDFATMLETVVLDGYVDEIAAAISGTLAFTYPQYIDFIHFIENIQANAFLMSQYPTLSAFASILLLELNNAVLNNFQHADFSGNANGISIFMPFDYNAYVGLISDYIYAMNDYAGLDWLANCYWDEFLDLLYTTGYFMAMDIEWVFSVGYEIYSSPAFFDIDRDGNPEIIFGSTDGYLYCIDNTGSLVWSENIGSIIYSSPTIADLDNDHTFEIIIGAEDGYLYCYDENGVFQWSYYTGDSIYFQTATVVDINDDGYLEIFIASLNGVHCLDFLGNQEWTYALGVTFFATPTFADLDDDGELEVLVGDTNGYFHCLDSAGAVIWIYNTYSEIGSTPAVADLDDDGYLDIVVGTIGGEVICLDYTGSLQWTADIYAQVLYSNIVIADIDNDGYLEIIYGTYEYVVCLDYTGHWKWCYYASFEAFLAAPVLADLTGDGKLEVIIGSDLGYLYCFASDGKILGSFYADTTIFSTTLVLDIDDDGIVELIFGNLGGDLFCLDLPDLGPTGETPYYTFGGTIFRTGYPDTDGDFIDELTEDFYGIDPFDTDSDDDSLTDWEEIIYYQTDPADNDTDGDGLDDGEEVDTYLTNPLNADTDGDLMPDGWEVNNGLNPLINDASLDPDSDGLTNLEEYQEGTDPHDADTDNDGLTDGDEVDKYFTDPTVSDANCDSDSDGLTNVEEVDTYLTDPLNADTDGDTLTDGDEVNVYCTDPCDCDSDDDTILDCEEVILGTDGFITDPNDADTDGDGIDDNEEIANGTDPTDPNDPPTSSPTPTETTTTTDTGGIEFFLMLPVFLLGVLGLVFIRKNRK